MKKNLCALMLVLLLSTVAFANEETIAHCENPQGKGYYPYTGVVSKDNSGWQDDSIKDGVFEFSANNGQLDVRYIDTAKRIRSACADGGQIVLLNKGYNEISVLAYYPGQTVEVYTLYIDKEGYNKFILTTVRGGADALVTKSSIMTGTCNYIYFDKFPEI